MKISSCIHRIASVFVTPGSFSRLTMKLKAVLSPSSSCTIAVVRLMSAHFIVKSFSDHPGKRVQVRSTLAGVRFYFPPPGKRVDVDTVLAAVHEAALRTALSNPLSVRLVHYLWYRNPPRQRQPATTLSMGD